MTAQLELPFAKAAPKDQPVQDGFRRPAPPPGFVFFKWRTRNGQPTCPSCGTFGTMWNGGGWADPGAQQAFDRGAERGIVLGGALDSRISYQGSPILVHWSRYATGRCLACDLEYWHDFGGAAMRGDWDYYYKPKGTKNAKVTAHQP